MTAKVFLSQIRKYDILIANKTETLARLRSQAVSITVNTDKLNVQTTARHDRLEETIIKIMDLESRILKDIETVTELKKDVTDVIDKLEEADEINLLYKRYVFHKDWTVIADEMNYSEQHILRLHGKALFEVQNVLNSLKDLKDESK